MFKMSEEWVTEHLGVTAMENDAKFEVGLACRLKNGMSKSENCDLST